MIPFSVLHCHNNWSLRIQLVAENESSGTSMLPKPFDSDPIAEFGGCAIQKHGIIILYWRTLEITHVQQGLARSSFIEIVNSRALAVRIDARESFSRLFLLNQRPLFDVTPSSS